MTVSVSVSMVVVMLVKEECADYVEEEADTANDQDQLGIFDALDCYEALDGLEADAESESKEECAIEEGTEELGSRPAERHVLRTGFPFRDVDGNKGDDESDEVGKLNLLVYEVMSRRRDLRNGMHLR
jgi:hypothetical protein